jgi:Berberine and berberine like
MVEVTLRIRLLGELDLRHGEVPVPPLGSARAGSLLAYLLLHRDAAQPRQRLAFLLWPDSSEPQARTNLRPGAPASTPISSPTRARPVETAYGRRLARLTALKDRDDPDNVFRLNANLPPTARHAQALVR